VWQVAFFVIRARRTASRNARWIWLWGMGWRKNGAGSGLGVYRAPGKSHCQANSRGALGSFRRIPAGTAAASAYPSRPQTPMIASASSRWTRGQMRLRISSTSLR